MRQFREHRAVGLIREALGPGAKDVAIRLVAATPWTVQSQVADAYRLENIFLIGDSARRFPPTGGLGLNTGLQDDHNLAWKLAAVIDRWAGPGLLSTYECERRPIACRNAEHSLNNLAASSALSVLDAAMEAEDIDAFITDPESRRPKCAAIELQRPHFDSVALQLGFGFGYDEQPIDDVTQLVPRALPGRRLPHGWLTVDGVRKPILDVVDPNAFTVLTFDRNPTVVPRFTNVPVTVHRIDTQHSDVHRWMAEVGLSGSTAVLVRPAGHILDVTHMPEDLA